MLVGGFESLPRREANTRDTETVAEEREAWGGKKKKQAIAPFVDNMRQKS